MKLRTLWYSGVALSLSLLVACGQPVCVAGIGQCAGPEGPEGTGTTTARTGQMNLWTKDRRQSVASGSTITLMASGGKLPYSFSVQSSMDTKGTIKPQGNGSSAVYEAPDNSGWVVIRVSDSSNPKRRQELPIRIE